MRGCPGLLTSQSENDQLAITMIVTLRLRIHYLFTTSTKYYTPVKGGGGMTCNFCDSPAKLGRCETCLKSIAQSCIWNYNNGLKQSDLQQTLQSEDVDPFSDMTIVGVLCLLKLACSQAPWESFETAPLAPVEPKLLLLQRNKLSSPPTSLATPPSETERKGDGDPANCQGNLALGLSSCSPAPELDLDAIAGERDLTMS